MNEEEKMRFSKEKAEEIISILEDESIYFLPHESKRMMRALVDRL